ncbi:MAG: glycosyltransferase family 39 protein [Epsilonproteobacteria bacterium]|nr:glycosyltransferase family 39 protein [Campylobacterota bacterium]
MSEKALKTALFLAILINFYLTLFLTPLFNLDEGAFSEATREMLSGGDYITTYLNGNLRFDKPILIYWLQALSVKIFGLNEFALRLPSALAATFWAFGIYWFAKRLFSEKTALFAAFIMVSTLQISLIAKAAIADSLLNMFIAFSMFSLYLYTQQKNKKLLYLTFGLIGFGFLTKGPVAVLIPLATYFIFSIVNKELKTFFKDIFNPKGIVIFSLIALPWYIAEYLAQGDKFINGFFLKHNIQRFESSLEKHAGSIFYFIPVVIIGLLPYTSLFFKYLQNVKEKHPFFLFGGIWFFFVFVFFSLAGTKLPHYVIYGYTPLFIFMALMIERIKSEFLLSLPFVLFVAVLITAPFILQKNLFLFKDPIVKTAIITLLPLFNTAYFALMGAMLVGGIYKFGKEAKVVILGFGMIAVFNYVGWIYAHVRAIPIKHAAEFVTSRHISNIIPYHLNTPSFNVYTRTITKKKTPKAGDIILTNVKSLRKFKNYKILFKESTVVIIKLLPPKKQTLPFNYKKDIRK